MQVLMVANFIGVVCARTLHFQVLEWVLLLDWQMQIEIDSEGGALRLPRGWCCKALRPSASGNPHAPSTDLAPSPSFHPCPPPRAPVLRVVLPLAAGLAVGVQPLRVSLSLYLSTSLPLYLSTSPGQSSASPPHHPPLPLPLRVSLVQICFYVKISVSAVNIDINGFYNRST